MDTSDWQKLAEHGWDHQTVFWNEKSSEMWEKGSRKEIMNFFLQHINPRDEVLDIGCASGYSTNKLYQAGMNVKGKDLSGEMIQTAKVNYPHICFEKADVITLPDKDESFHGIIAINVLEWVEVPVMAVQELYRVLKTNGTLCIGVLGPTAGPRQHAYERLYGNQVMMNTMQPWEFANLAIENGFRVINGRPSTKQWWRKSHEELPIQAQQALSFMWVFILKKQTGENHEVNGS